MELPEYDPKGTIFTKDYTGRLKHSYVLYHPRNLMVSDEKLIKYKAELDEFVKTGKSQYSRKELWDIHYLLESNMHPETGKPVQKLFRWSAYCPVNIPIIVGLSVLPPTPLNQFIFQTINQSYNFGVNFANSTSSNVKSGGEIATSYGLAVSCALLGSIGLRQVIQRSSLSSTRLGKGLMMSTPFFGLIFANSVNLLFSRSKELSQGIAVNHPTTGAKLEGVLSKTAAKRAILEALMLRWLIPIPSFFIPLLLSRYARKNFTFYQKRVPALVFDGTVAYLTIWASLVFAISFFSPTGQLTLGELEPEVSKALPGLPPRTPITFNKGI